MQTKMGGNNYDSSLQLFTPHFPPFHLKQKQNKFLYFATEKLAQVTMFDKCRAGGWGFCVFVYVHLMEMGVLKILVRVLVVYFVFVCFVSWTS